MIQINLLPDVKQEYLRSQQTKHTVIIAAILSSLAAIAVLALIFVYVQFVQSLHRSSLQKDIDSGVATLKSRDDAIKIVTVQGVLEQLPALQDKKVISSNVFNYLKSFTPRDVAYSTVSLDFKSDRMSLNGTTVSYEQANILANNLKSARFSFTKDGNTQTTTPFSGVVFDNLSTSTEQGNSTKNVTFQLGFQFDPTMFSQGISQQTLQVNASSEELILPSAKPFTDTSNGGAQ